MNAVEEGVLAILRSCLPQREGSREVVLDTELAGLGVSSLNLMQLIVRLESAFDMEFADEHLNLACFETVRELARYIEQRSLRSNAAVDAS